MSEETVDNQPENQLENQPELQSDSLPDIQNQLGDQPGNQPRHNRKVREGYVVSDRMDKTIVVRLEDRVKHPLYGKVIRHTSKVKAHDEGNIAGVGDRVLLMETRPLSATKRWRLVEIVEKAK